MLADIVLADLLTDSATITALFASAIGVVATLWVARRLIGQARGFFR